LAYLGLVRRIGGKELPSLNYASDGRGDVVGPQAAACEGRRLKGLDVIEQLVKSLRDLNLA